MHDSAVVYGRMFGLQVAHPTPSESLGKRLGSVYPGCNIPPPLIEWQARKAR